MPWSYRLFSALLFVFLDSVVVSTANTEDKCGPSQESHFALAARYANQSCLFEVWGVRKKVNVRQENGSFVFDGNLAEAICHFHNATLPIIESEAKEKFVLKILDEDGAYVLGLKRNTTKPVWDTGAGLNYSNRNWRRNVSDCHYTLLVRSGSSVFWEDAACNAARAEHVLCFCEEFYNGPTIPNRPLEPPWLLSDKCDPLNEYTFRRTKNFKNQACYFEVEGADDMVNKGTGIKKHGVEYFAFDVEASRRICANHNASLPILRSQEEERFLLEFIGQNFNYIALGMQETKNGYVWDDGTLITYANPDWRKRTKTGSYYTLLVSSLAGSGSFWLDVPANEPIPNGVQVICRENYGHSSGSTSSGIAGSASRTAYGGQSTVTSAGSSTAKSGSAKLPSPSVCRHKGIVALFVLFLYLLDSRPI